MQWFALKSISECWIIGGCSCFLVLFSVYLTQKPKWLLISHNSDVYVEMLVLKACLSSILFFNFYSLENHWYCKMVHFLLFLTYKKYNLKKIFSFSFSFSPFSSSFSSLFSSFSFSYELNLFWGLPPPDCYSSHMGIRKRFIAPHFPCIVSKVYNSWMQVVFFWEPANNFNCWQQHSSSNRSNWNVYLPLTLVSWRTFYFLRALPRVL